ncbi:MAG: DUF3726 domain-containing protein [Geminicoccaceae bacterium]
MSFSLNEIEAMGKRATRGAGLPWGLAEEAGKAARWLVARGLPGAEQLADILTRNDKRDYAELAPADVDGVWQAPSGCLCPLVAGAAICDRAAALAEGRVIELGKTAHPLLLVPYVAGAAKLTDTAISIGWGDVIVTLSPDGESIDGDRESLTARSTASVHCRRASKVSEVVAPVPSINEMAVPAWDRLAAFAQRTFAPATEASRLSGAGAGLSDNN